MPVASGSKGEHGLSAPHAAPPTVGQERARVDGTSRPLWLHFSERKLLFAAVDGLLINLVLVLTLTARPLLWSRGLQLSSQDFLQLLRDRWSWFLILTVVWFVCALMLDCYNLGRAASVPQSLSQLSSAVVLTSLIYLLIPRITPTLPTSRLDIFAFLSSAHSHGTSTRSCNWSPYPRRW